MQNNITNKADSDSGGACCTKRFCEITQAELPLSCPPINERVWDGHPRVYLPIEETETGKFVCPYCGTEYVLKNFVPQK